MDTQERRAFFQRLFMDGRFIPKIQALADASNTCLVCSVPFVEHPRNYHATTEQISASHVCSECGVALTVRVADEDAPITTGNLEYVPCQFCFRGIPASHFAHTAGYAFSM